MERVSNYRIFTGLKTILRVMFSIVLSLVAPAAGLSN